MKVCSLDRFTLILKNRGFFQLPKNAEIKAASPRFYESSLEPVTVLDLKMSHQYKPVEKKRKTQPEVAKGVVTENSTNCAQVNSSEKVSRGVGLRKALLNVGGRAWA